MNHHLKPLILLAVGGFLLSVVSWYLWIEANQQTEPAVFGVVIEVGTSTLTISNKREEKTEVMLTATTTIWRSKEVVPSTSIRPGNFVQVIGSRQDAEHITADEVRLLRSPKEAERYE